LSPVDNDDVQAALEELEANRRRWLAEAPQRRRELIALGCPESAITDEGRLDPNDKDGRNWARKWHEQQPPPPPEWVRNEVLEVLVQQPLDMLNQTRSETRRKNVEKARKLRAKGLSQDQIAVALDVSQSTVSRYLDEH
jgi:hypothetical protein